ncbi:MAG TPA: aconitase/3-isopropylmalate dehydratase large subunit family protein [Beijerinckiaceae bacterium]|jgi:3-isopropylmalate/(R)-2-methylmalate dehydratase large subunit|nr:aconitase/3-isopropylmalate dehydratase large subunit family protein [Beijerinckiaceae bacterium]
MESPKGRTIAEKILGAHADRELEAGEFAIVSVDQLLGTDGSAPMAIDLFASIGFEAVFDASRIAFSCDHYAPASSARIAALHEKMRSFAEARGITLFRVGEGIGHQRMIEDGRVRPGMIVAGADSHCVTYGALNAFGIGIGASDLAAAMATGKLWLKVPHTLRIILQGRLRPPAQAKDIILELLRRLRADGADYLALEFSGDGAASLSVEERIVIANMATEAGAKAALFAVDQATRTFLRNLGISDCAPVAPDAQARYIESLTIDLAEITARLALPHQVDSVVPLGEAAGRPVDMVFIGTCTGGRASDIRAALAVIREAGGIAPGVELVITPASRAELELLIKDGSLAELTALGAVLTTPGCGACCGTSGAIPRDGATVISTGNRNFKGRMGAPTAEIFLASPAACGAAAATGRITNPKVIAS